MITQNVIIFQRKYIYSFIHSFLFVNIFLLIVYLGDVKLEHFKMLLNI